MESPLNRRHCVGVSSSWPSPLALRTQLRFPTRSSSLRFSGKVARPIRYKSRKMMCPPLGSHYFLRHFRSCASSACSRSSESGKMSEVLSNLCLTAVLTDAKKAIALIAKHLVLYDRYVLQAFLASSTSSKRPMSFFKIVEVRPCAPK